MQGCASVFDIYRAQTLEELKDDLLNLTFELISVFLPSLSVWRLLPIAHSGKAWKLFLGFLQIWWCFLKLVLDDSFWRWRTLQLLLEVLWTWLGILNPLHGIIRQVPCCMQGTQSWNWLKLLSLTFPPDTRLLSRWRWTSSFYFPCILIKVCFARICQKDGKVHKSFSVHWFNE